MLDRRMLLPLLGSLTTACQGGKSAAQASPDGLPGPGASTVSDATLVVVFQRFAANWINMLIPAGDEAYARQRPNLRIPNPLPIDPYFVLHPALSPLEGIYASGHLAFVTATGWIPTDSRDRCHFFAQTIAESGARSGVHDGWLGRVMQRDAYNGGLWAHWPRNRRC